MPNPVFNLYNTVSTPCISSLTWLWYLIMAKDAGLNPLWTNKRRSASSYLPALQSHVSTNRKGDPAFSEKLPDLCSARSSNDDKNTSLTLLSTGGAGSVLHDETSWKRRESCYFIFSNMELSRRDLRGLMNQFVFFVFALFHFSRTRASWSFREAILRLSVRSLAVAGVAMLCWMFIS